MTMYAFSIWGNTQYVAKEINTVREMENYLIEHYQEYLDAGFKEFVDDMYPLTEVGECGMDTWELLTNLKRSYYQDLMLDGWLHDYIRYKLDRQLDVEEDEDPDMNFGNLCVKVKV